MLTTWPGALGQRNQALRQNPLKYATIILTVFLSFLLTDAETGLSLMSNNSLAAKILEGVDNICGSPRFCNSSLSKFSARKCSDCAECFCDDICHYYGDCCLDWNIIYPNLHSIVESDLSEYVSCISPFKNNQSVYVVAKCPKNLDTHRGLILKCGNPDISQVQQATLVTDSRTNITFRNQYCAQCHGVSNYVPWDNQVTCKFTPSLSKSNSQQELWEYVLNSTLCDIRVVPPNGLNPRSCIINPISTCDDALQNDTWNETTEMLCKTVNSPLRYFFPTLDKEIRQQWYKNVFCLQCNGIQLGGRLPFCSDGQRSNTGTEPLSVLLNFRSRDARSIDELSERPKCGHEETYDAVQDVCRQLKCSDTRLFLDGTCQPRYAATQWLGYAFSVTYTTQEKHLMLDLSNISYSYEHMLREKLSGLKTYLLRPLTLTVFSSSVKSEPTRDEQYFHSLLVEGRIISFSNETTTIEFENVLKSLGWEEWIVNLTRTGSVDRGLSFPLYPKFSSCSVYNTTQEFTSIYERRSLVDSYCLAYITVGCDDMEIEPLQRVQYTNVELLLDCPFVEFILPQDNFRIDVDRRQLVFKNVSISLNELDYLICEGTVKICSHVFDTVANRLANHSFTTGNEEDMSLNFPSLGIVSLVCNIVSLLCLTLTFLIFLFLPKLRTLPGKNTMSLVVYLFLAQLVFLVGIRRTEDPIMCQALGITIHFLWIASFLWMAVCAFHMYKVFTDLVASRHQRLSETSTLLRYYLLTNVIALTIVLVCVIVHVIISKGTDTGYGDGRCFISRSLANGIAFGGPLALVLALNVFFFARTVYSIRNIPDMKTSRHNGNRQHVTIYFRLSVLLGFSWILAFVNEALENPNIYISYLFEILTGCQGLFIFCAFCLSRRTIEMIKDKLCKSTSKKNGSNSHPYTDSTSL